VRRLILISCLALSACNSATRPSDARNQMFTLAPGQIATTKVAAIRIQFVAVTSDSRCPIDLNCLLAGDATVNLNVQSSTGTAQSYDLHTASPQGVVHDGATITLTQLTPSPISTRIIAPGDYRAMLHVAE
jgi:hypothetical protein